ncbi:MAG TPA: lysylphosphatidylglycerol synthase transmembrane domain-containing protein [Actinomycetes bacterium]|nr:lysylphosphatidylglycerol synthase transmembrane domain-containing protein [Actinomycetes bacterium]
MSAEPAGHHAGEAAQTGPGAAGEPTHDSGPEPPVDVGRLARWQRPIRVGFVGVAVSLGAVAVVTRWDQFSASLHQLDLGPLLLSLLAAIGGSAVSMMVWRSLLTDLGTPVPVRPVARVFFVGQLGKYVPGAIWPLVAQMELGRSLGLARRRSAAAFVLTMLVVFASALVVAAVALPLLGDSAPAYRWLLLLAAPVIAVLLFPRVTNRLLGLAFRLLRREPLEQPLTGRGLLRAFAWSLVAWSLFGLHIGILVIDLGAPAQRALPVAFGAFAIAWCAGPIIMIAPAGAGIRELALVALLAPVLDPGAALVVALTSRLFLTIADLLLAGGSTLTAGGRASVHRRATSTTPSDQRDHRSSA